MWKGGWQDEMTNVTAQGYRAILSTCWYLDYISYGSDWVKYYQCEPMNFTGMSKEKKCLLENLILRSRRISLWFRNVPFLNFFN